MRLEDSVLTHVDQNNQPTMVDVTEKLVTPRSAKAQSQIQLPEELKAYFKGEELVLKKGPVFQTAIIAATMAVKKTYETIPFCHQIPIESCKVRISTDEQFLVTITCEVKTTFKTGVEMEALHGAMVAALTIYDMCKAVSHKMIIQETRLLTKTGGKTLVTERPVYGLVLTGGKSSRMEEDKATINYRGVPHAQYIHDVLRDHCEDVYLSAREGQWDGSVLEHHKQIHDSAEGEGPIRGILSAFEKHPEANWLVVACDLVHFNELTVQTLLQKFKEDKVATCFTNAEKGFPEALCAIYTPSGREALRAAVAQDIRCPVKVLRNSDCELVELTPGINLANINTKQEYMQVQHEIS
jgi:cyclic pyranopterin phosphate synthase